MKIFLQTNIIVITLFLFVSCLQKQPNKTHSTVVHSIEGKVIFIKDGDTYTISCNEDVKTIRLEHIDCPEKKQPFGNKAKEFAYNLCLGKPVIIKTKGKTDRNNRLLGEVILKDGTNINQELVKNGLAWHFKKYSDDSEYARLEIEARRNQIGIWSESNATAPWTWRKK